MDALGGQIDTDWEFVNSRVDSLMSTADDAMSRVRSAGEAMQAKADEVATASDDAVSEDGNLLDSARTVVEALDQGVQALIPDIDGVVAGVEDVFSTMGSELQSEFSDMDSIRSAAEDFLRGDFSSLVNTVGETVLSRCSDLGSYVSSDALVTLADEVGNLSSHVDDIVSQASSKLDEVRSAMEEEGNAALDSVKDMFNDKFGGLIQTAQTVADLVDRVGQAIASTSEAVGEATKLLGQGVNLTAIGAKSALGIIEDITEIFSEVT
jgi:ElaB/YqjD/DUF883 family membrane-anchored ribosome-binding protein